MWAGVYVYTLLWFECKYNGDDDDDDDDHHHHHHHRSLVQITFKITVLYLGPDCEMGPYTTFARIAAPDPPAHLHSGIRI